MITGMVQITAQASKSPHAVISLKLPLKAASPTVMVLIESESVTIRGHIKLFQVETKVNIARVTSVGVTNGTEILKKVITRLQPSILAESSKSFGIPEKACFNIKIPNPPKKPGIIKALYVSIQCNLLIRKNNGIILTCGGTIIVIKIRKKSISEPLNFSFENAYPASAEIKT